MTHTPQTGTGTGTGTGKDMTEAQWQNGTDMTEAEGHSGREAHRQRVSVLGRDSVYTVRERSTHRVLASLNGALAGRLLQTHRVKERDREREVMSVSDVANVIRNQNVLSGRTFSGDGLALTRLGSRSGCSDKNLRFCRQPATHRCLSIGTGAQAHRRTQQGPPSSLTPHSLTHSLTHSHTHSLTHTHAHSLIHTHTYTHTHTHTLTHTRSHTHSHTYTHTHTHSYTQEKRMGREGRVAYACGPYGKHPFANVVGLFNHHNICMLLVALAFHRRPFLGTQGPRVREGSALGRRQHRVRFVLVPVAQHRFARHLSRATPHHTHRERGREGDQHAHRVSQCPWFCRSLSISRRVCFQPRCLARTRGCSYRKGPRAC
jgi:hypothetical protein